MGINTQDYLFAVPEEKERCVTIDSPFDISECIKQSIGIMKDFLKDDDWVSVTDLEYGWSPLQVDAELKNVKRESFIKMDILRDTSDSVELNLTPNKLGPGINNRVRRLQADENIREIVDCVLVLRFKHLKKAVLDVERDENRITSKSICAKLLELGLSEYKPKYEGLVILKDTVIEEDIIEDKDIHKTDSSPRVIENPLNDLLNEKELPTKQIETDPECELYKVTIAFEHLETSNPRLSGMAHTWKTLIELFHNSRKFKVFVTGVYPFDRTPIYNYDSTTLLDECNIDGCYTSTLKMNRAFCNSNLVICRNYEFVVPALEAGAKVLIYLSPQDSDKLKSIMKDIDDSLCRMIINPNPNINPVELFDNVRDFLGIKKKV